MEKLSVILITKNEEADLGKCLDSIGTLASQTVIVDDFSTDRTPEIARTHGAEFFQRKWDGFGQQKQFALEKARHEWVLNIDADERLAPGLCDEIREVLRSSPVVNGYKIPFQHVFMGRPLRFGAGRNESHVRLFRRDKARYPSKTIHEGIAVEPPLGHLKNTVLHMSYRNLSEYLQKCDRYTTLIAQEKWKEGRRFSLLDHLKLPGHFFKSYFLKLGFLDGAPGLSYAALSAYYSWMKSLKLLELEKGGPTHAA
jgi:glycosyltransferase involved in cell wall biosynthesis